MSEKRPGGDPSGINKQEGADGERKEGGEDSHDQLANMVANLNGELKNADPAEYLTDDRVAELQSQFDSLRIEAARAGNFGVANAANQLVGLLENISGDYLDGREMKPDSRMAEWARQFRAIIGMADNLMKVAELE